MAKDQSKSAESQAQQAEPAAEQTEPQGGHAPGGEGAQAREPTPEELQLTLQDAEAKADEYWNQLLRAKAEMNNLQRRAERELENAHKYGLEKFTTELLPVVDSLELGLGAAGEENTDPEKLREGMELTLKMLLSVAEKFGVKPIAPQQGERFDPERHQAMSVQESPGAEPNTVLTVYQKGYTLNDRLIRPAMVVVSGSAGGGEGGGDQGSGTKIDEMA